MNAENRRIDMALKLISLNIERDLHYGTVLPFLCAEKADIVCLQEVLDHDVPRFERELGMRGFFAVTGYADRGRNTLELAKQGVTNGSAIFTLLPVHAFQELLYYGTPDRVPSVKDPLPPGRFDHSRGALLVADVEKEGKHFRIATTHFTWTPDGEASDAQREDMKRMIGLCESMPDLVLCGDFNMPRGREMWEKFALRYKDNIPLCYESSMDPKLHLKKGLSVMVDGLFTTPEYRASDVQLVEGVSDHKAVVGYIERV